jgi:hypothetical protein
MKYQEIRTVWSDQQQLKEAELKGYFNIEVGDKDKVIVPEQGKSASIFFGSPYDESNWKGYSKPIFENEDIRIIGNYSECKEHDGKLLGFLLIKKVAAGD